MLADSENKSLCLLETDCPSVKKCGSPDQVVLADASNNPISSNNVELNTVTKLMPSPVKVIGHIETDAQCSLSPKVLNTEFDKEALNTCGDEDGAEMEKSECPEYETKSHITLAPESKESLDSLQDRKRENYNTPDSNFSSSCVVDQGGIKAKKKKATGRIIPSRYMQMYSKKGTVSQNETKDFKTSSLEQSNLLKSKKAQNWQATTPTVSTQTRPVVTTSTPTNSAPKPCHDASAISVDMFHINSTAVLMEGEGVTAVPIIKSFSKTNKIQPSKLVQKLKSQQDLSSIKPKQKLGGMQQRTMKIDKPASKKKFLCEENTPKYLDAVYGRYLQSLFCESKAEQVKNEREHIITNQLTSLARLNEMLRQKAAEQDLKISQLRHFHLLYEQLDSQLSELIPAVNNYHKLEQELGRLTNNLDETRHQLPLRKIKILEDDPNHETILSELLDCEKSLSTLSKLYTENQLDVEKFSQQLDNVKGLVLKEFEDIKECEDIIDDSLRIALEDSSLKIQAIQMAEQTKLEQNV